MSESNAMPDEEEWEPILPEREIAAVLKCKPEAEFNEMAAKAARCELAEQRVQELEAALRELLYEHCCDDGGVDYKGTAEECLTCIPARRVLSKGAQPKEKA